MQNLDHGILLNDLGMEILYSGMDVKKKIGEESIRDMVAAIITQQNFSFLLLKLLIKHS